MNNQFQPRIENQESKAEYLKSDNPDSELRAANSDSAASADHPVTPRWKSYQLLLLARLKEMYREPEVIFWVFIFPILLALGLGIAFRNRPADVSRAVVVAGPGAAQAMELLHPASAAGTVHVELLPAAEALNQFRLGKYDL